VTSLELKVPPPVVALILALAAWGIDRLAPVPQAPAAWRAAAALALAAVAATFDIAALLAFRRARTTVNPMRPRATSAMVTGGVYRLTRNPMYVGLALFLSAWAVWLGSPWAWAAPAVFVAYITRFQVLPEERALGALFGADYAAYRARVRRWL
jgi:protein-S-isoprenylcysteine O-methyltransferase Ste14